MKVGYPIASDSVAFEVPGHWIQTGPGSLRPLSLPSPTNATPQEDNPYLQQALAQLRAQPLAPQARNPGLVSLKDRHRVALPTSSGLEELCLGWRLSLLISP